jgi:hypothetical protein
MSHTQYKVVGDIIGTSLPVATTVEPLINEEHVISTMINNESIQLVIDRIRLFIESLDFHHFTELYELAVDLWHWLITWSKSIPERTFIVASVLLFIGYMILIKMKKNQM